MPYEQGGAENARLLMRTINGWADFSGRSRRTEVLYYWIAATLVTLIVGFLMDLSLSPVASKISNQIVQRLFEIPTFAMFARRLHDQNRSGWWSLLLVASVGLATYHFVVQISGEIAAVVPEAPPSSQPLLWFEGAIGLVGLVLFLVPGTVGPNRFGADPRGIE